jgi:D-alanyl-D-alanine carboxypeptidase
VSTARDLSTFYSALLSGKVLPEAELAQMRTTVDVSEDLGVPSGYGLGVYWMRTPCGTIWGHDGATFGSASTTFTTSDGKHSYAADVTTRLYSVDPADPRLQSFAAAYGQAQLTAICGMYGKAVPSGQATLKKASRGLEFLAQRHLQARLTDEVSKP